MVRGCCHRDRGGCHLEREAEKGSPEPAWALLMQEPAACLCCFGGQEGLRSMCRAGGIRMDPAFSSCTHVSVCTSRTKRRWKKQPIRSLLCKRPKKWLKSAPCLPRTSPLLRKALRVGCGWKLGYWGTTFSWGFLKGPWFSWRLLGLSHSQELRWGMALLPAGALEPRDPQVRPPRLFQLGWE